MNGRIEDQLKIFKSIEKDIIHFPRYVIDWYFYLKANDLSATTCKDYINKIKRFLSYIGNGDHRYVKLETIDKTTLINYFAEIQDPSKNYTDSYRQSTWSCLNNFFEYLYNMDYISENYLQKSHIKRGKNKDLERINKERILLTKDDFKKIVDAVENGVGSSSSQKYQSRYRNRDMCIILLFMITGMRKTALREINVDDLDLNNKKLYVIDKGRKTHEYALSDNLIKYLECWITDRYFLLGGRKHDALFISRDNNRISGTSISDLIDKYAKEALGYHISPHKLRGGFISILYEEKHDLEFVRRAVGHSDISTTQRYLVTNNSERTEASNMIDNILL